MRYLSKVQLFTVGLAVLFWPSPSHAIVTAVDSTYITVSSPSLFDGVAKVNLNGSIHCSGALLNGGTEVLTAAHCVSGQMPSILSVTFPIAGGLTITYNVATVMVNPNYASNGQGTAKAGDIALLTLTLPVDPAIHTYGIYKNTDEFGQVATLAGYGGGGQGSTGNNGSIGPLRTGTNRLEADPYFLASNFVTLGAFVSYDFDDGTQARNVFGDLGTGGTEGISAPGDSGGPSFLLVNGNLTIAGVHSFIGRLTDANGNTKDIAGPNGPINATFGEFGGDARVSTYASWIETQLAPEPSTFGLMAIGLGLAAAASRRRRI